MKHLSPAEFVDEIEGRLPDARKAHLGGCANCTERAAALRAGLSDARDVEMPEPSPLFWDHLSARVRGAIGDSTPAPAGWWRHPALAIMCSIVLVAAVVAGVLDVRTRPVERNAGPASPAASSVPADAAPVDDPAFNLLTDVASTIEQDDPATAPLSVRPSTVDRAVGDLSAAERRELGRLLKDELKGSGH